MTESPSKSESARRQRAATQYLVEVYAPEWSEARLHETCEAIRLAEADCSGKHLRYLHSVLVPREETALFLFEAEHPGSIEDVLRAVELEAECISPAIAAPRPDS
jgi:hypothetical protein